MKIGLAFPEYKRDNFSSFATQIRRDREQLDLVLFPDGFESLDWPEPNLPNRRAVENNIDFKYIYSLYQKLADETDTALALGISIHLVSGGQKTVYGEAPDEWAIAVVPGEQRPALIYHKNTTSAAVGLSDPDWNTQDGLPVFEWKGYRIGMTQCHDMFNSLLPAALKKKNIDLWLNPSYANVRSNHWRKMLRSRSVEFDVPVLNTLFCDPNKSNPQKEVFAFTPNGEINLAEKPFQTGRIYMADLKAPKLKAYAPQYTESLPKTTTACFSRTGKLRGKKAYLKINVPAHIFLHHPEMIWNKMDVTGTDKAIPVLNITFENKKEFERLQQKIVIVMPARAVEFSTFISTDIPEDPSHNKIICYRSSNYKDTRLSVINFKGGDFKVDERYLFGPQKTIDISLPKTADRENVLNNLKKLMR